MSSVGEENCKQSDLRGFWTGEMINAARKTLFDPPRADAVDGAAYILRMGAEVYISPTDDDTNAKNTTVRKLKDGECFYDPAWAICVPVNRGDRFPCRHMFWRVHFNENLK